MKIKAELEAISAANRRQREDRIDTLIAEVRLLRQAIEQLSPPQSELLITGAEALAEWRKLK